MLPTLLEFGIEAPAYIREIRSRTRWNPEGCDTVEKRARVVAENLFDEPSHLYSIWLVSTDQELYNVIASRTDNRNPRERDIDFIWITEDELQEVGIIAENKPEGNCLRAQHLHFNVQVEPLMAEKLCECLIRKGREAKRFGKKAHTTPILESQKKLGCKATESGLEHCECEQ
ncbi:hypothetical protein [Nostoc sp.]|uniref:hypothetical protein n=1 Tax=Nostoc sp. TaxID=1180 RepID=UPI002FF58D6C